MNRRTVARSLLLVLLLWVGLAFAGGVMANPFEAAVAAACDAGDWPPDDVRFLGGSYRFLLVTTLAEARLVARRGGEDVAVAVELRHVPFLGWELERLAVGDAAGR